MEKHATGTVFIVTQEEPRRFLFVFHKKFQIWTPPGGHVEFGENPLEAAVREAREETGIELAEAIPKTIVLNPDVALLPNPFCILEERIPAHGDKPEHWHVDFNYIATVPFQIAIHDADESEDIRWFTHEETKNIPMFEDAHLLVERVLDELGRSSALSPGYPLDMSVVS